MHVSLGSISKINGLTTLAIVSQSILCFNNSFVSFEPQAVRNRLDVIHGFIF